MKKPEPNNEFQKNGILSIAPDLKFKKRNQIQHAFSHQSAGLVFGQRKPPTNDRSLSLSLSDQRTVFLSLCKISPKALSQRTIQTYLKRRLSQFRSPNGPSCGQVKTKKIWLNVNDLYLFVLLNKLKIGRFLFFCSLNRFQQWSRLAEPVLVWLIWRFPVSGSELKADASSLRISIWDWPSNQKFIIDAFASQFSALIVLFFPLMARTKRRSRLFCWKIVCSSFLSFRKVRNCFSWNGRWRLFIGIVVCSVINRQIKLDEFNQFDCFWGFRSRWPITTGNEFGSRSMNFYTPH